MKRPVMWMCFVLFLWIFFILNSLIWLLFPLGVMGILFVEKNNRLLMIIFLVLISLISFIQISKIRQYVFESTVDVLGELRPYKNDYYFKTNHGYKILVKSEEGQKLKAGTYVVTYKKSNFFNQNPKMFNYKHYLLSLNFVDVIKVSESTFILIKENNGMHHKIHKIYKMIESRINRFFNNTKTAALVKGLLLGDKSQIDPTILDNFRLNGTSHVLAISGMHIGLIYITINKLLSPIGSKKQILSFILILEYLIMIGVPYSALRAFFLFFGSYMCKKFKRPYDPLQTLGLAGIFMMVSNIHIIYHTGFQFSFCAVLIIVVVFPKISNKIDNKIIITILLSLTLQVFLMPLMIYHQLEVHLLSFLVNTFTVFLITGIMYLGFFLLIFPLQILMPIIDFLAKTCIDINMTFSSMSNFIIEMKPLPIFALLILYFFIIFYDEKHKKKTFLYLASCILICHFIYTYLAIEVYFLDLGQGDGIMIKHQGDITMIDSGASKENRLLKDILKHNRVKSVDTILLSHSHSDHIGGFYDIQSFTQSSRWFYKSLNHESQLFKKLYKKESYNSDAYEKIFLKGLMVKPIHYLSRKDLNNASMVLWMKAYHMTFLFTGDIEEEVERAILPYVSKVDVLKVPHHGSNTSSTDAFVKQLNPQLAIICVGKNNYGHPNINVVEKYVNINSQVMMTKDGYIKLVILPLNISWIQRP